MDTGNTRYAFALAALLHIALLATLRARPSMHPGRELASPSATFELDLAPTNDPSLLRPPEPASPDRGSAVRATTASTPASSTSAHRASGVPTAEPEGIAAVLTAPTSAVANGEGEAPWSLRVARGPDLLARGQLAAGRASIATSAEGAVAAEPPTPSTGIAEALTAADVERGLGRGGPVVSALEEVARTSDAPVRGIATFEVTVDRSGKADVRLDSADAEATSWAELARSMSDAVAKKAVRVPSGARGLRVTVQIDARVQYPNGRDTRALGNFVHATGLEAAEGSMVVKSVPGVNMGHVGKVCGAGLHVGIDGVAIQGGCDPENIGAVPVRIVHGRELREVPL